MPKCHIFKVLRNWKDNENIKIKHSRLYLIGAGFLIVMSSLDILFFKYNWQDIMNLGLGIFLVWGVKFNGLYKIARYLTEKRLKRRDNKFDYFHT